MRLRMLTLALASSRTSPRAARSHQTAGRPARISSNAPFGGLEIEIRREVATKRSFEARKLSFLRKFVLTWILQF